MSDSLEFMIPPIVPTDLLEREQEPSNAESTAFHSEDDKTEVQSDSSEVNTTQESSEPPASELSTKVQNISDEEKNLSPTDALDDGNDEPFPSVEEIRKVIYDVVDPEINISIIDLGLVYDIIPDAEKRLVQVKMTLTSPGCPLGPEMTSAVYHKVTHMPGVKDCDVELVWSPAWDPMVHANEETRITLGIW